MNRRQFLGSAGAAPALGLSGNHRNILLLYCEQFQHNVGSVAGGPAKTPGLERFAAEAVHFRTACTTTALCSPARAALFTGRLGHRTGLDDNCWVWHSRLTGLDPRHSTLIEWARRKNYFTGYYGKWHLGKDGPIRRGAQRYPAQGFERRNPAKSSKPDFSGPSGFYDKGRAFLQKPGFYTTEKGTYGTCECGRLARAGTEFLREAAGQEKPFFLTVSFNAVHPPYNVVEPYASMYDPKTVALPENLRDTFERKPAYQADVMWPFHDTGHMGDEDWRRAIAYYRGFVTLLDRALGEILDAVRANGFWGDTLIVLIADHGDMAGAHNRFDKGPYCYDEVMRIPLLIRWPGIRPRAVDRHVHSMDVNQTVVEWAGFEPDVPNVDSRSLRPLMEQGDGGWPGRDEAFYRYEWYNGLWFGIRAIRTPEYKYCFNPAGIDELYDLRNDAAEMKNLIGEPAVASVQRDLERRLLAHLLETSDTLVASRMQEYLAERRAPRAAK